MKYFVANWKARKNLNEARQWLDIFLSKLKENTQLQKKLNLNQIKIIIFPPFPLIYPLKEKYGHLQINLEFGAQDISFFDEGSFTGEVPAKILADLIKFVILGHSERRILFKETTEIIKKKVEMANKYKIEPIVCVRSKEDLPTGSYNFIAYEPVEAIGTGNNQPLVKILEAKKRLQLKPDISFFYGGSVDEINILDYLKTEEITGFLISTASLDPINFYKIISSY